MPIKKGKPAKVIETETRWLKHASLKAALCSTYIDKYLQFHEPPQQHMLSENITGDLCVNPPPPQASTAVLKQQPKKLNLVPQPHPDAKQAANNAKHNMIQPYIRSWN